MSRGHFVLCLQVMNTHSLTDSVETADCSESLLLCHTDRSEPHPDSDSALSALSLPGGCHAKAAVWDFSWFS